MRRNHLRARLGLAAVLAAPLVAIATMSGSATGYDVEYCSQIPIVQGIPPWGFHTGAPITGAGGSYARGHGDISLTRTRSPGSCARSIAGAATTA